MKKVTKITFLVLAFALTLAGCVSDKNSSNGIGKNNVSATALGFINAIIREDYDAAMNLSGCAGPQKCNKSQVKKILKDLKVVLPRKQMTVDQLIATQPQKVLKEFNLAEVRINTSNPTLEKLRLKMGQIKGKWYVFDIKG